MSFQDVSNPQRTARLTRQHQLDRRSRSERLARSSPERAIRIRGVSEQSIRCYKHTDEDSRKEGFNEEANSAVLSGRRFLHNSKQTTSSMHQSKSKRYSAPSLLSTTLSATFSSHEEEGDALVEIRSRMQQRSKFAQLVTDIRHFQALVKDLEMALQQQETTTSPESAWRTRILWTSALETDSAVTQRLMDYERTLHIPDNARRMDGSDQELRTVQSACLKLHRDVQRTHRSLQDLLTKTLQTQQFDIQAQLGSVAWSSKQVEQPADEVRKMNSAMHQVNDLVQELAGLVHTQQEPIDHLEETVQQAHDTVESGYRQVSCTSAMENPREMLVCGELRTDSPKQVEDTADRNGGIGLFGCGVDQVTAPKDPQGYDRNITIREDDDDETGDHLGCDWNLQWQHIRDGVLGLRNDLVLAGRDLQRMNSAKSSTERSDVPSNAQKRNNSIDES